MAALVCDLCGGKLIMGAGGTATCDSCGMEHSLERMKEKVQEIKGVVQVDNTHMIDNYIQMAQNAYNSNNKQEAESYCNKIIEIMPSHGQAWLIKGKAAGWQSTLSNIRFPEAINCFAKAVEYFGGEDKTVLIEECTQEVKELAEALLRLRSERFEKWPDEEEKNGFIHDLTAVLQAMHQFFDTIGYWINKDEIMSSLAIIIGNSVMAAWNNVVRPTFEKDHNGYPGDYEFNRLIERALRCIDLLEQAINLSDSDSDADIRCYENMIAIHKYLIDANSYSYETVQVGNSNWDGRPLYENQYVKSKSLTGEAKLKHKKLIRVYENKIADIKKENDAKARNAFWIKFPEERSLIDDTIDRLKKKRTSLSKANTGYNQVELIDQTLKNLTDMLEKNRTSEQVLSSSERDVISDLSNIWDKLQKLESKDAFFDKNPLLKEESAVRKKLCEDQRALLRAETPEDEGWILRIIGCIALIVIFIYFLRPFTNDFTRLMAEGRTGNAVSGLLLVIIFILGPTFVGAVACVFGPIKRLLERRKTIIKLEESIESSVKKLEQIDAIKHKTI